MAGRRRWRPRGVRGGLLAVLALVLLAVGGFAATYALFFSGSSARPFALPSGATPGAREASGSLATGVWSLTLGSVAGYRVREKLAFLPAKSDAVGRTSEVAGTMTLVRDGAGRMTVTAASFLADVRTLTSDQALRDARIHSFGLESDSYPTAGFRLTRSLTVPAAALRGQVVRLSATGLLTIHGTTRVVTIPLTARLQGSRVETVGSITFPFARFRMQAPSIGNFVSVENHATMEFDLRFQPGASARNAALFRTISAAKPGSG